MKKTMQLNLVVFCILHFFIKLGYITFSDFSSIKVNFNYGITIAQNRKIAGNFLFENQKSFISIFISL